MARQAETCGAVAGALMVIGLKYGQASKTDKAAKERTYALTREFVERFVARHGSIVCRDILGVDIGTDEGYQAAKQGNLIATLCPGFGAAAVEILEQIL